MARAVLLIVLLSAAVGCVSTQAILVDPTRPAYAEVSPDSVRFYTSESELDTLVYERIAVIEATGSGEWTSQTGMYGAIRKKAAKLGANGVLFPEIKEPGAGAKVAGAIFGTGTERKGSAIAIRVLGRKAPPPSTEAEE